MRSHEVVMEAFLSLWDGNPEEARETILKGYPFDPSLKLERPIANGVSGMSISQLDKTWNLNHALKMRVFERDGFTNRFNGKPLVLTAVLRLLSREFPAEFPYHHAWKVTETHNAYDDLGTCANKLLPPTRGGKEELENLITTTMPYVTARGNATVEEVMWSLEEPGDSKEWDGLSTLFIDHVRRNPELKKLSYVKSWYPAAVKIFDK